MKNKYFSFYIIQTLLLFTLLIFNSNSLRSQVAQALNFDGTSDYVDLGTNNAFKPTSVITVETWASMTSWNAPSGPAIIGNTESGGWSIGISGTTVQAAVRRNGAYGIVASPTILSPGWHHLAMTYDGQILTLYVDGVSVATNNAGGIFPIQYAFANSTLIGAEVGSGSLPTAGRFFPGNMDETRVWNVVRTQTQIQNHMNCEISSVTPGLVANYHFNQGIASGNNAGVTTLTDASGNGLTGNLFSFSLSGGASNWISPGGVASGVSCGNAAALNFDGTNDHVNIGAGLSNAVSNGTAITIEYWFKGTNAQSSIRMQQGGDFIVAAWSYPPLFIISTDGGTNGVPCGPTGTIYDGNWHHMACVWEKNRIFATYLDGVIQNSVVASNVNLPPLAGAIGYLGTYLGSGEFTNGNMDEVRVWDRALCVTEIQNNMNGELQLPQTSLLAYYQFNQGLSGGSNSLITTLNDAGPNAINGTLVNFGLSNSMSNWVLPGGVTTGNMAPAYANPTLSISGTNSICSGASTNYTASGAINYTWTGGPNTSTYNISPNVTTTYSVIGRDNFGCLSNLATKTLSVNTTPTVSVNSGSICSGNSFTIIPSGANTYTIEGGGIVVSPTTNTSYTVIGTSTAGCISANTSTSIVTVNITPTVTTNSGSICSGNSFTIIPGGANTYTIEGGSTIVSPTTNTSYTVIGTSTAGCISFNTATTNLTVNSTPTVSANSGSICSGNSFTIIPGGANTYTIEGGSSVVSPTANTSYTVIGTSTAGCISANTSTTNVIVNSNPTISVNSGSICSGNSFTIIPTGANTYTIEGGNSVVSPTSNITYTVLGTSTAGCIGVNTASSNVTVNLNPTISVNSGSICSGNSFTIVPAGANTYSIEGGNNVVSPTSNTTFTIIGISAGGCSGVNTATANVTVNANPTVSAITSATDVICAGQSVTLSASGADTYSWSTGGTSTIEVTSPTITTNYSVIGTSTNGCTGTAVITQSVSDCTGFNTFSNPNSLSVIVYPNPGNGIFHINIKSPTSLTLFNALGKQILSTSVEQGTYQLDLTEQANGIYFLTVTQNNQTRFIKLIKQ